MTKWPAATSSAPPQPACGKHGAQDLACDSAPATYKKRRSRGKGARAAPRPQPAIANRRCGEVTSAGKFEAKEKTARNSALKACFNSKLRTAVSTAQVAKTRPASLTDPARSPRDAAAGLGAPSAIKSSCIAGVLATQQMQPLCQEGCALSPAKRQPATTSMSASQRAAQLPAVAGGCPERSGNWHHPFEPPSPAVKGAEGSREIGCIARTYEGT
jgi:hypothetical protein